MNINRMMAVGIFALLSAASLGNLAHASGTEAGGGSNTAVDEKKDDERNEKREELRKRLRAKRKKAVQTETPPEQNQNPPVSEEPKKD